MDAAEYDESRAPRGPGRTWRVATASLAAATATAAAVIAGALLDRDGASTTPPPAAAASPVPTSAQSHAASPTPSPSTFRTPSPTTAPRPRDGWVTTIPAGFPIDRGLDAPETDTAPTPSRDGGGRGLDALRPCGVGVLPAGAPGVQDRLAAQVTGPEYADGRELLTFADAHAAAAVLATLRDAVEDCPLQEVDDATSMVWSAEPLAVGGEGVTVVQTYEPGVGGGIHQLVRVGNALLVTVRGGEWSPPTVPVGVEMATRLTEDLVPAMCVFSAPGC